MRCRLTLSRRATTVHTNSIRPLSNEGKSMAVIAVWQCDRDGSMFEDKKQAEEHDKYLELAANITHLIETELDGINESQSEAIGLLLDRKSTRLNSSHVASSYAAFGLKEKRTT